MTLERMDIEASTCADVASARDRLARREFQLCLTDMRLPDGDGIELIEWMQGRGLKTPVAVITAHGNVETAVRALKAGAFDFISKPLDVKVLRKLVGSALKVPRADVTGGQAQLLGESAAHRAPAPDHRQGRPQPGAGAHHGRVGHRQGAGGPHDPRAGLPGRGALRAGQLRRHPQRTHGERVLRPPEGLVHRAPSATRPASSSPPRAARCSWTRSPTCRCPCR